MTPEQPILSQFHPLVARWFAERVGRPTDVQAAAWPRIAGGEHVLITAPTGSGKTLTAFLWSINQLVAGRRPAGRTSVLYVSPLKALNNDIQRNLLGPLGELERTFAEAGEPFPPIRVLTRSGDTPQSDRRRMKRRPPEILITTPESLNLLLSSAGGRSILTDLATVILDEIHAVVAGKRGAHLISAVERLVRLSGEFQRIALSATVRPLETVAAFVGGYRVEGDPADPHYEARPVAIVRSGAKKRYDVRVRLPEQARRIGPEQTIWDPLADEFRQIIESNRSTLLFANSRRLVEKLTLWINAGQDRPIAYAHHGSLSREIRLAVERKLKAGELKAIVATNSLEMGIDVGALDEVVLIQSPRSISSAIQRVGRAGHRVGEISRAELFPTHARDCLDAAVLAPAILDQDIEAVRPVRCPLDVLAQVIVSMAGAAVWDIDELYAQLRASWPYHVLGRREFDLVLEMLAGRYAEMRIRELKARVSIDRLDNTVSARPGALRALYTSGGVIPDRGYFHIRHEQTGARIGELDEEFVWEATTGQTFALGTQHWRIRKITHNDVLVAKSNADVTAPPFWRGEQYGRDFHFSERIGLFLREADAHLEDADFAERLEREHYMDAPSAGELIALLKKQKAATGCGLPHRWQLLVEHVDAAPGGAPGRQIVLHTLWGARVNRPLATALEAAWEGRFGHRPQIYIDDDALVLMTDHDPPAEEILSLVTAANVEKLLRERMEGSGFFGARFRECAGRALLVTRGEPGRRMPLWLTRVRSQKLLRAVLACEDFPILLEAWRTCLQDEFDLPALRQVLSELEAGTIAWAEARSELASPFAQSLTWQQTNTYMYMTDELGAGASSRLRRDLLQDVVFTPGLRPAVARELVEQFERKRLRLAPGYAPSTPRDLLDWVRERLAMPTGEWERLLDAMASDHGLEAEAVLEPLAGKLVRVAPPAAAEPLIIAAEALPRVVRAFWPDGEFQAERLTGEAAPVVGQAAAGNEDAAEAEELLSVVLGEWLAFYGPGPAQAVAAALGLDRLRLAAALDDLVESRRIVRGRLIEGGGESDICDSENFEILLRLARSAAAPAFEALETDWLPVLLARCQGLIDPGEGPEATLERLERFACLPARAELWEAEILPARLQPYQTAWIDGAIQEGGFHWIGCGEKRVAFCFGEDLELMRPEGEATGDADEAEPPEADGLSDVFHDPAGRYDFPALRAASGLSPAELTGRLWRGAWRGQVTNDSFLALRRGIETDFSVPPAAARPKRISGRRLTGRGGRRAFARWRASLPMAGNWLRLPGRVRGDDLIDAEERKKDRARILLDRYGVVFRELLRREEAGFRWADVFRSLRLMELSGEVLGGCFFHGIAGLQFASRRAYRLLQRGLDGEAVWWVNAADPASVCGLGLEALRGGLPPRLPGNHLVYRGPDLVVVSRRHGSELTIRAEPGDPRLPEYLGFLVHLLTRAFRPVRRIRVETINGGDAADSPHVETMRDLCEVVGDYRAVILYRRRTP